MSIPREDGPKASSKAAKLILSPDVSGDLEVSDISYHLAGHSSQPQRLPVCCWSFWV
jgi:hypothetical protein